MVLHLSQMEAASTTLLKSESSLRNANVYGMVKLSHSDFWKSASSQEF